MWMLDNDWDVGWGARSIFMLCWMFHHEVRCWTRRQKHIHALKDVSPWSEMLDEAPEAYSCFEGCFTVKWDVGWGARSIFMFCWMFHREVRCWMRCQKHIHALLDVSRWSEIWDEAAKVCTCVRFLGCFRVVSGVLQMQKSKSPLLRTQSWKVSLLKPGMAWSMAMHAMPAARDNFLSEFCLLSPFALIFSNLLPDFLALVS